MAKRGWERAAKDRFLRYLRQTNGEDWAVLGEDCPVGPRDFDFQLGLGGWRMALELFRLTDDGPTIAAQNAWLEISSLIQKEFEARGIVGLAINTPPYFSIPKVRRRQFVKDICDRLEPHVRKLADGEEIRSKGFCIARFDGLQRNYSSRNYGFGVFNPVGKALEPLKRLLPEKNAQLNMPGHERLVLIVSWAHIVTAGDMIDALNDVDLQSFTNIDRIYFETALDQIELVFQRPLTHSRGA